MGGTLRAHPGLAEARHTYGYAYGTDSGATRRPRVPFPKSTRGLGGLQTEKGPKAQVGNEPTDDGVTCMTAANFKSCCRYAQLAKLDIPFHW